MKRRVNIAIVEPSQIVRDGIIAILERSAELNCNVVDVCDFSTLKHEIGHLSPDIIITSPINMGESTISLIKEECEGAKIIALVTALYDSSVIRSYDASISMYDSEDRIISLLSQIIEEDRGVEPKNDLTQREREIVICIARGMTNKEIADELSLSTHTVISHRRNITTKLEINSSSGLTIYAIVNGLIEVNR